MKFQILSCRTIHNIACLALMSLPSVSAAQGLPALSQTLYMPEQRITVAYPDKWSVMPGGSANAYELINVPAEEQQSAARAAEEQQDAARAGAARIIIITEHRTDHAEAVRRLKEIAEEEESSPTFLNIGGWPALQRRHLAPLERSSIDPTE